MSTAQLVYNGMFILNIVNEIKIDKARTYSTSPYSGGDGSSTEYVSQNGRVITCKSLCTSTEESRHGRGHRINDYITLAENNKDQVKVLTSPSVSGIDGNYMITGFDYVEDTGGNFTIDWEFTEVIPFNVTQQTFRVWGKKVSSASKKKKTTSKTSGSNNVSSNVKYLLGTCGTMKKGSTSKKCVQSLQKFLQSKGYYKGYKVDGLYQKYTEQAVKGLQKANKLKVTGQWDTNTRKYWQKKYKYPTVTVINKGTIGNRNAVYTNNKMVKIK